MERLSTTAFGPRPIAVGQILERLAPERPAPDPIEDKWTLMQDLTAARAAFGVGDRDLLVLNALLSFRKGRALDPAEGLIVFPSNATLSDRVHGMAESTLSDR
ncbi:MAG: helix-turn-helix domain-containing protein, partial [Pseudomonadota bacterium]